LAESEYAILLEDYRAVFINIAKVASSSLKAACAAALGFDLATAGGNPHELAFPRPPEPSEAGERLYPGFYTFSFVRNPWDRLVSCYRDKILGEVVDFTEFSEAGIAHCLTGFEGFSVGMSFDSFVETVVSIPDSQAEEHIQSQFLALTNKRDNLAVDFVGRYETLAADFQYVAVKIGLPPNIALPRLQTNPRAVAYTDYYSAATRDLVAARFAQDIALFSYRFG
jgi:hypothetical protein